MILNLLQSARGFLLPAVMLAAVIVGALASPAQSQVYSPNGVELTPAEWAMASTDGKNVTVKEALTNSENAMITNGVKGVDGYTLTVMSFWGGAPNGDYLSIEVRQNGSVAANCRVSSAKDGSSYDTTC
jgi:Tfp pilus assembly major pilin PilA